MNAVLLFIAFLQEPSHKPATALLARLDSLTSQARLREITKEVGSLVVTRRDVAQGQLADAKNGVVNRQRKSGLYKGVWNFETQALKDKAIAEAQSAVDAANKLIQNAKNKTHEDIVVTRDEPGFPLPGVIAFSPACRIMQVLDDNRFIGELVHGRSRKEYVVITESTKDFADGDQYKLKEIVMVVGKEKFDNGDTLHVIKGVTLKEIKEIADKE